MHQKIDTILSFYKFTKLSSLPDIKNKLFKYLENKNIYGTVIIANEGINVNICGNRKNIDKAKYFFENLIKYKKVHYNQSKINSKAFTKLKVKIKNEIIKAGFQVTESRVQNNQSLDPDQWNKLLDKKPILIDMRNRFEFMLGSFNNAKSLDLLNFSDIRASLQDTDVLDKNQNIAIFCTGGIRCEKAAIALKDIGFQNIYQLKGGIVNYIDNNKDLSHWEGDCFVFDDRITL